MEIAPKSVFCSQLNSDDPLQPSSESKENKGDDAVISSVVKGHMDWRHVHLISRLTGKGSSVSQTFACRGPKSINTSTGRRRLTRRSLVATLH